jgi:hypothetical protein
MFGGEEESPETAKNPIIGTREKSKVVSIER